MSSIPDWIYALNRFAHGSLIFATFVWGAIVCFRRWHVCSGARLAGVGFVIAALNTAASQLFALFLSRILNSDANDSPMLWLNVYSAVTTLLHVGSFALIVLGLRSALVDVAKFREGVLRPADDT